MQPPKFAEFVSCLMTAISSCALYGESHPLIREFSSRALTLLPDLCENDALSIVMIGGSLIVNDEPCVEKGVQVTGFMTRMKKKRIDRIVFRAGLDEEELRRFFSTVASRDALSSSPHIAVGTIEVKLGREGLEAGTLLDEGAGRVKEAIAGVSRFRPLDMTGLEDAVVSFLSALRRESKMLRIISPVKTHNEYTYIHATNVSVLTIFQAETLGMKGEELHDIGLAGLLHDIGKMFVATEVLDKPGGLDPAEWNELKQHPLEGAVYLSRLADVPPLASIVAFEHHMKFDGSGYPDTRKIGRTQHLVSQMVAISDVFDALRTERPYRKALDVRVIAGMLREGAQRREFNPVLVDSFLSSLAAIACVM